MLLNLVNPENIHYVDKFDSFDLNINTDILETNISELTKIAGEITSLDIIQMYQLKSDNINYLDHMLVNYPDPNYDNLSKDIDGCIQQ